MINTCQTNLKKKHLGCLKKSLTRSITYMPTSHSILHYTTFKINTKIYVNFSEDAQKFLLHKVSHFSPRVVKYQRETWLMNKLNVWYSIYIVHGGNLVPQTWPTCNSKLQIIKLSFVWSADPKRWGTPTSKTHNS